MSCSAPQGPQEEGHWPTGSEQLHAIEPTCGTSQNRNTPQALVFLSRLEINETYLDPAVMELTISFQLKEPCLDFLEQGKWRGEVRGRHTPGGHVRAGGNDLAGLSCSVVVTSRLSLVGGACAGQWAPSGQG